MAAQIKTIPNHDIRDYHPELLDSEPLQINDLLNLIALANEFGYTVKSAHCFKAGDKPILAEIYTVWFAIKHELLIFRHNIPKLSQLYRIKNLDLSISGY